MNDVTEARNLLPTLFLSAAAGGFVYGFGGEMLKGRRGHSLLRTALGAGVAAAVFHGMRSRTKPRVHVTGAGDGGMSFEDAWAHAEQHANIGQTSGPDPIEKIRAELSQAGATIVSACAPETTSIVIKAAIQNGHAVGVSVYATPPNSVVSACIASRVRRIHFTASGYMDAVTATF
jgi:hypothetical protein